MPAENESPAREPATRGRGRGGRGRGGRGRGGGRGGANAAVAKAAATKTGRGGSRRGRAKNFSDSRVQAAYERQRHLKATYQAVAHALKPALQELAERSIDDAIQNPDTYKHADEHFPVIRQLQNKLQRKLAEHERRLQWDLKLAEDMHRTDDYVAEQEFMNGLNDIEEQFWQSQENRARILAALQAKGLPVDVRDDQYEYQVISDEHFDKDFGIYECYKNGNLVPYPSRVEGTEMWQKARDAEAAVAATTTVISAPARGGGRGRGRGGTKRRAQEQPEGQPTPKKSTRLLDAAGMGPAPAKGLLASALEVEDTPEGTPGDEDSVPASPEPPNFLNGLAPAALTKAQGKLPSREKSPPLPKNISDPDEYGFRIYNQRSTFREKGGNSRLFAPHLFWFEEWEIGFRDSVNDSSKGHNRTKRGKYLDTPNSNGMHFDHWCNGYDFSSTTHEDFDLNMIKRYGVHPKYGVPLPNRPHTHQDPSPCVMPGKPVVYIANPSGRVHHASRSFLKVTNFRRSEDDPWRAKIGASMRRFCKIDGIDSEDISISEYVRDEEELRTKSLGTAVMELGSRPVATEEESEPEVASVEEEVPPQSEGGFTDLSVLTYASAFIEAEELARAAARAATKPARYDAIRDVFTDSKPAAAPAPETDTNLGLNLLAQLSNAVAVSDDPNATSGTVPVAVVYSNAPESDLRSTIDRGNELPLAVPNQIPVDPRFNPTEAPQAYMHTQPRAQPPMQPTGPVHPHPADMMPYPPVHDHVVAPHQPVRPSDYPPPPPPPGHPGQEQGQYMPHGYPNPDHRDIHMGVGRPMDPGFDPRRMSGYGAEPAYSRAYWSQQPPPGPPPPVSAPGPSPHYQSQPLPPSRIPFSHNASAEPLPPLRPPRGRNQSVEEAMIDPNMRPSIHNNLGGSYYPQGPSRSYHQGYGGPERHGPPPLQPIATDRILPNPQTGGQGYMTSPNLGYAHQVLSPTYGNPPSMAPMVHSPQENPRGLPDSIHRHRSTPSGSSDAGGKYRKLQPAPVPAHRAWPNKPELKTIPYDHKETGSAAALPSSGPTQIRGWNVNQHRKRGKSKGGSSDASGQRTQGQPTFQKITFAKPLVGAPPAVSHDRPNGHAKTKFEIITVDPSPEKQAKGSKPQSTETNGLKRKAVATTQEQEANPMKRRLRPRKLAEPEVVITAVRPSLRGRKPFRDVKKPPTIRKLLPKVEILQDIGGPASNEQVPGEVDEMKAIPDKNGHDSVTPIEITSTDEEEL
ncbi:hypothetical protein AK830_g561 [Neonectria ditissima]|uniref:Uncharacterized protein n=1 Tax=Neonectria ditissima TaxID=78410 RepID=A0A0P7BX24_9HYPO|nr:hypothetical protein AK830_g561 [Neonectria ditissima]